MFSFVKLSHKIETNNHSTNTNTGTISGQGNQSDCNMDSNPTSETLEERDTSFRREARVCAETYPLEHTEAQIGLLHEQILPMRLS